MLVSKASKPTDGPLTRLKERYYVRASLEQPHEPFGTPLSLSGPEYLFSNAVNTSTGIAPRR